MLPKKFRLPATTSLADSQQVQTLFFTLKIKKNSLSLNRYGFVVGKHVDNRATVRNKVKRKLRAYVEKNNTVFSQGYDFLFILKREIINIQTMMLWGEVEQVFKKQQIL